MEYIQYMGRRSLIGCLKLQVIFRKRATNFRALLQKMTYEDTASNAVAHILTLSKVGSIVIEYIQCTGWCEVIWCLIFIGHFQQKSPGISGSFAKKDLQLKASYESSPPCSSKRTFENSEPIAVAHIFQFSKESSTVNIYTQSSSEPTFENSYSTTVATLNWQAAKMARETCVHQKRPVHVKRVLWTDDSGLVYSPVVATLH